MTDNTSKDKQNSYEQIVDFARHTLNDNLDQRDAEGTFDRALWQACCDYGVTGLFIPEEYGGAGMDIPSAVHLLEGLGYGCRDNGLTLGLNGQMWSVQEPILSFGNEEQKKKYLGGMCDGTMIGACGMTEAESGSDAFSLKTTAQKTEGGYILNGHKSYIGLAEVADIALIFASTNPEMKEWGISCFIVERGMDGFSTNRPTEMMGLRTNPLGDITLKDCFVPEANRLGPEGIGVSLFNNSMDWERGFILSSHVGAMAHQLDQCLSFVRERKQFDKAIGDFQAISHRISQMKVRLETSRLLLQSMARMKEDKRAAGLDAAICKLHMSESIAANTMDAFRIHGARGYTKGSWVERDMRDFTSSVIYSGTSDIQRNIIARFMGL